MQRKLNVPLILQAQQSKDCGPVCIQMILRYYGIDSNLSKLKKSLKYNTLGTTLYDNACILLEKGIKTTIVTGQPRLFPADIWTKIKTSKSIIKIVNKKIKDPRFKKLNSSLLTIKKYIDRKGKIQIAIPNADHIKRSIDKGNPVLALIYGQGLGSKEGGLHFVVITGYRKNQLYINNPLPKSKRQYWVDVNQFLYSLYTSTYADVDNGSLLIPNAK